MDSRESFLRDVLFSNAFAGMSQRGHLYIDAPCEIQKAKFRQNLKNEIENYVPSLLAMKRTNGVDYDHNRFIEKLSGDFSKRFSSLLKNEKLRIGSTQKIVNLYLKLLWCANLAPEPPHCPMDGVVIRDLLKRNDLWTELDDICEYKELIQLCREAANNKTIAGWELVEYARVQNEKRKHPMPTIDVDQNNILCPNLNLTRQTPR